MSRSWTVEDFDEASMDFAPRSERTVDTELGSVSPARTLADYEYAEELAAVEYLRPGFLNALRDQVVLLTHRGDGRCPIQEARTPPTFGAAKWVVEEVAEAPKAIPVETRNKAVQTEFENFLREIGC